MSKKSFCTDSLQVWDLDPELNLQFEETPNWDSIKRPLLIPLDFSSLCLYFEARQMDFTPVSLHPGWATDPPPNTDLPKFTVRSVQYQTSDNKTKQATPNTQGEIYTHQGKVRDLRIHAELRLKDEAQKHEIRPPFFIDAEGKLIFSWGITHSPQEIANFRSSMRRRRDPNGDSPDWITAVELWDEAEEINILNGLDALLLPREKALRNYWNRAQEFFIMSPELREFPK